MANNVQKILEIAKEKHVEDNPIFVQSFLDYVNLRKLAQQFYDGIELKGPILANGKANPAVSEYQKVVASSISHGDKLLRLIQTAESLKLKPEKKTEIKKNYNYDELEKEELILVAKEKGINIKGKKRKQVIEELNEIDDE